MKSSMFSDAQKAFILKQGEEGTPVAEICRKAGISQATPANASPNKTVSHRDPTEGGWAAHSRMH